MSPKLNPALGETPAATNLGFETSVCLFPGVCQSSGGRVQSGVPHTGLQGVSLQ